MGRAELPIRCHVRFRLYRVTFSASRIRLSQPHTVVSETAPDPVRCGAAVLPPHPHLRADKRGKFVSSVAAHMNLLGAEREKLDRNLVAAANCTRPPNVQARAKARNGTGGTIIQMAPPALMWANVDCACQVTEKSRSSSRSRKSRSGRFLLARSADAIASDAIPAFLSSA